MFVTTAIISFMIASICFAKAINTYEYAYIVFGNTTICVKRVNVVIKTGGIYDAKATILCEKIKNYDKRATNDRIRTLILEPVMTRKCYKDRQSFEIT